MPLNPANLPSSRDPKGHKLVDYTQDLNAHPDKALADEYRTNVLGSPHEVTPLGASEHAATVATLNGHRYALSPYFAKTPAHVAHLVHYPISGWSQMATQALYRAGGVGHLVPHTHVVEHPTANGEFEPFVATHLAHGLVPFSEGLHEGEPQAMADAAKIGFVDFLINNHDRHDSSLLVGREQPEDPVTSLQALGHDRAFQYKAPNRWQRLNTKHDHLMYYLLDSPGMAALAHDEARVHGPGPVDEALSWWQRHGKAMRGALVSRAAALQNRFLREHVVENFQRRADALDKLAGAWRDRGDMTDFSPYSAHDDADARIRASFAQVPVFIHKPE